MNEEGIGTCIGSELCDERKPVVSLEQVLVACDDPSMSLRLEEDVVAVNLICSPRESGKEEKPNTRVAEQEEGQEALYAVDDLATVVEDGDGINLEHVDEGEAAQVEDDEPQKETCVPEEDKNIEKIGGGEPKAEAGTENHNVQVPDLQTEIQQGEDKDLSAQEDTKNTIDDMQQMEHVQDGNFSVQNPAGEQIQADTLDHVTDIQLAKDLSSTDKDTFVKAIVSLRSWLCSRTQVDEAHLSFILSGLFYQVWRTRKGSPLVELTGRIVETLRSLRPETAVLLFKLLLSNLSEEWSRIDKKKVCNFRCVLHGCLREMFRLLKVEGWNESLTSKFIEAVGAQTRNVGFVLLQPFFQELKLFVPPTADTLKVLLEPFISVYASCDDKVVLQKVRDAVFVPLLQEARAASRSNGVEDKSLGSLVLGLSMSVRFFEMSSSPLLSTINKKLVKQLYEDFKKSERPLPALRPLRISKAGEGAVPMDAATSSEVQQEVSVTGSKRKRVNAAETSFEHKRVLRSDHQDAEMNMKGEGGSRSSVSEETRNGTSTGEDDAASEPVDQPPAKRVRFSLKDNVVWSAERPLPPAWVTVPPRAAPRGSALKAGVCPGPIAQEKAKERQPAEANKTKQKKKLVKRKKNRSKRQRSS